MDKLGHKSTDSTEKRCTERIPMEVQLILRSKSLMEN